MRTAGAVLMMAGALGFFYCTDQAGRHPPVPEGRSISESLEYPGGRWEVGRFACAILGGFGVLLVMFPKGR